MLCWSTGPLGEEVAGERRRRRDSLHRLPDWVGTNGVFTEGQHISYIVISLFKRARDAACCHMLHTFSRDN